MDGKLFTETTDAVRQITERFGVNILTDHKRFCAAFSDFAPRLSKENKAFYVALSENIGEIFINENHAVANGSKSAEEVIQRAMADICEYLNEEKAELIARSIASALGWQAGEIISDSSDVQSSSFVSGSTLIEDLFRRAQNGDNDACFNLGECFFYGRGVSQDYAKAIHWYTQSSDRGDCSSQKKLADCYYLGQGTDRNLAKAAMRYEQAAEQGDYDSQKALIRCYAIGGTGLMPDRRRAEYYSKRYDIPIEDGTSNSLMKRAQNGDPEAQFTLGNMYLRGTGIEQDYEKAIYWLKMAAQKGHAAAQYNVACCYYSGTGVPEDKITAVNMFKEAAEKGDLDAMNNLGGCFMFGSGTAKDQYKAAECYRKAAEGGLPRAQYNYGECFYNGWGVSKDTTAAVKWFKESANQSDPNGQYSYGWCLCNGVGTAKDPVTAKMMFELAAGQRHTAAQKALGYCYTNGWGTAKNYAVAADYFGKAAANGDKEAAEVQVACYKYGGEFLAVNEAKARYYADQYGIDYDDV